MDKGVSENNKMCGELKRISNILSNLFLANNFRQELLVEVMSKLSLCLK